jgi:hypothetical protein
MYPASEASQRADMTWRRHIGKLFLVSFSLTDINPIGGNVGAAEEEEEAAMDQFHKETGSEYHVKMSE